MRTDVFATGPYSTEHSRAVTFCEQNLILLQKPYVEKQNKTKPFILLVFDINISSCQCSAAMRKNVFFFLVIKWGKNEYFPH